MQSKDKIFKIINKFAKIESKYYKYLQQSLLCSSKMSNMLKNCIVESDIEKFHSFYVDYTASDGLALRFDYSGGDYVCDVDKILQLTLIQERS